MKKLLRIISLGLIICLVINLGGLTALAAGQTNKLFDRDYKKSSRIYNRDNNTVTTATTVPTTDYINIMEYGAVADGITDNSEACYRAFEAAQNTGKVLYFPAGKYNLNHLILGAQNDLLMTGDPSGGTVLVNAGVIYCYADVNVSNMAVTGENDVFLYLEPRAAVSVTVDNIQFSGTGGAGESRFIYCGSESTTNCIDKVQVTNCSITDSRYGIILNCMINSGIISGNKICNIGSKAQTKNVAAIHLGYQNSTVAYAKNVTISNNDIRNIFTMESNQGELVECQGIILYSDGEGGCIIENNYLENIYGGSDHEGIYCKAVNIKILNNTLINTGDGDGAIVNKKDSSKNDILISGNTITDNIVATYGIQVTSSKFTISNNTINMISGIAIMKDPDISTLDAVITGNKIDTNGRTAIYLSGVTGTAKVSYNTINHTYESGEKLDATLNFICSTGSIEVSDNNINYYNTNLFNLWNSDGAILTVENNSFLTN